MSTDQEILSEIQKGNEDVLLEIFREHYPTVLKLVKSSSKKNDPNIKVRAEEITAEAVVSAWQMIIQFRFKPGMKIKNVIIENATELIIDGSENFPDESITPVLRMLRKLDNRSRSLLHFYYFEKLSIEEIASSLAFRNAASANAKRKDTMKQLFQNLSSERP